MGFFFSFDSYDRAAKRQLQTRKELNQEATIGKATAFQNEDLERAFEMHWDRAPPGARTKGQ